LLFDTIYVSDAVRDKQKAMSRGELKDSFQERDSADELTQIEGDDKRNDGANIILKHAGISLLKEMIVHQLDDNRMNVVDIDGMRGYRLKNAAPLFLEVDLREQTEEPDSLKNAAQSVVLIRQWFPVIRIGSELNSAFNHKEQQAGHEQEPGDDEESPLEGRDFWGMSLNSIKKKITKNIIENAISIASKRIEESK